METGDMIVFILCLVASGFFVAMGIPCSQGWVRPNRLYGFRTRKTLQDPDVWYPTNSSNGGPNRVNFRVGNRVTMTYDALHRLAQTQNPLGGLSTVLYEAAGNVLATTD